MARDRVVSMLVAEAVATPVHALVLDRCKAKTLSCQSRAMATIDTPAAATRSTVMRAHGHSNSMRRLRAEK